MVSKTTSKMVPGAELTLEALRIERAPK